MALCRQMPCVCGGQSTLRKKIVVVRVLREKKRALPTFQVVCNKTRSNTQVVCKHET